MDPWAIGPASAHQVRQYYEKDGRRKHEVYHINTGFPFGIYALENFRAEDANKMKTFAELSRFSSGEIVLDARLGYAYCASLELAQQYVNAAQKYAQRQSVSVIVVTNQPVSSPGPGVKIISMRGMPFSLNQKVIKSTDIPILVTGDGSLSLAIEGQKTFFYSAYQWKLHSALMLRNEMLSRSPTIKKDPEARRMLTEMLTLDMTETSAYESLFLRVFENESLQKEFARITSEMTKDLSLIKLMRKDFSAISSLRKSDPEHRAFYLYWRVLRQSKSQSDAFQKIERSVMNPKYLPANRMLYLRSLLVLENYPVQRGGALLSKFLLENNRELKFEFDQYIGITMNNNFIKKYYTAMSTEALAEYEKTMRRLAHPSNSQADALALFMAEKRVESLESYRASRAQSKSCDQLFISSPR